MRARGWLLFGALALGAVASALFMKSVFLAPVAGDDRVAYPQLSAMESLSVAVDLGQVPHWWEARTHHDGRANVMSIIERRTAGRMVVATSVDTGTPTYVVHGVLKLLLAAASVLTLSALLKSLRGRRRDGALVRLSGRTVVLGTLVGGVVFALGGRTAFHYVNGHNGWVNYPTHTYGAVASILGVTALLLWLTRLYAEGRFRIPIILVLVILAVLTNFRYELVLPAGPLALIALLLVPVTSVDRAAEGRRAKWVTGTSFVGVFMAVLVGLRIYLHDLCEAGGCYSAVTPQLSWGIARTFWLNVTSSIPGTTAARDIEFVEKWGISADAMYTPTPWSMVIGGCMAAALLVGWWATRPADATEPTEAAEPPVDDGIARGSDEGKMLVLGAGLCLLGALGAAGVMSLSAYAQSSPTPELPYRHTVITWAGIAWAVALGALSLRHRSPRTGTAAWVALSLAVGVAATCLLPANERSLAADRVVNHATTGAFAALVNGDLSDSANAHRCRLVPGILKERNYPGGGERSARFFDAAFRHHWGQEFCRR